MTGELPKQSDEAGQIRLRMQALDLERRGLEDRLRELETPQAEPTPFATSNPLVTNGSSAAEKVALFRRLFAGRTDGHACSVLLPAGTIAFDTRDRRFGIGAFSETLLLENSRMDTPASSSDCGHVRSPAGRGDHAFPFDGT